MTFWDFANEHPWAFVVVVAAATLAFNSICRVARRAVTRRPVRWRTVGDQRVKPGHLTTVGVLRARDGGS